MGQRGSDITDQPILRPRVLVVDDEPTHLQILERWLAHAGYAPTVVQSGFDAVSLARQERFEVVVTDLRMPGMSGLQLLAIFKELDPLVEVIFLSGQGTMNDAIEALREGKAFDFLQKPLRDLGKLTATIEAARARREKHLAAVTVVPAAPAGPLPRDPSPDPLTDQEVAMLRLLAQGLDNRTIGESLSFSEKTVKNYLSRAYQKLGVANRVQALVAARKRGVLE